MRMKWLRSLQIMIVSKKDGRPPPRTTSHEPRTENREPRTANREPRTANCAHHRRLCTSSQPVQSLDTRVHHGDQIKSSTRWAGFLLNTGHEELASKSQMLRQTRMPMPIPKAMLNLNLTPQALKLNFK